LAVADPLAMDNPLELPCALWNESFEPGHMQRITDLGTEDDLQGKARREELGVGWFHPGGAVSRETAGWNEDVDVGVKEQGASPGMEDGENSDTAADVLWIGSEREQALGSSTDEDAVYEPLIRSGQGV